MKRSLTSWMTDIGGRRVPGQMGPLGEASLPCVRLFPNTHEITAFLRVSAALLLLPALRSAAASMNRPADLGVREGILHIGNGAEPRNLDPATAVSVTENTILGSLFEGLVRYAPDCRSVLPGAAERWDVSPDGKVYTFHLRPGLKWSNGDPLTADGFPLQFSPHHRAETRRGKRHLRGLGRGRARLPRGTHARLFRRRFRRARPADFRGHAQGARAVRARPAGAQSLLPGAPVRWSRNTAVISTANPTGRAPATTCATARSGSARGAPTTPSCVEKNPFYHGMPPTSP